MNTMALIGMSAGGQGLAEQDRARAVEAIVGESAPVLEAYAAGSGIAFELASNLATARR